MQKVLIDCDPGHDDALAILCAAAHMDLVGITTVYGNQSVDKTTRNALSLATLLGLDVPVARGAERPLNAPVGHGGDVHGRTGIDGAELPEPDRDTVAAHAVDLIIETARANRGELVLCPVGPFTNVALALRKEPRLAGWLKGISVMGGSAGIGNVAPVAEFNVHSDPEAADIVFRCGAPLWMVGLDITRQVGVGEAEIARLNAGGRVARVFGGLLGFFRQSLADIHGLSTASLHDPCALVPFIAPETITYRHCPVEIELAGRLTRGMTVCDLRRLTPRRLENIKPRAEPNCHLAVGVRGPALVERIVGTVLDWDRR